MVKILECGAFMTQTNDNRRVVILAQSRRDAHVAAYAHEMYQALKEIIFARDDFERTDARREARKLLDKIDGVVK